MLHAARLGFAFVAVTWLAATLVSAADKLTIAVGQREIWHGAPAALGERAGIFRKHDLDLELLFTSGSGETQPDTPNWNPSGFMRNVVEQTPVMAA